MQMILANVDTLVVDFVSFNLLQTYKKETLLKKMKLVEMGDPLYYDQSYDRLSNFYVYPEPHVMP